MCNIKARCEHERDSHIVATLTATRFAAGQDFGVRFDHVRLNELRVFSGKVSDQFKVVLCNLCCDFDPVRKESCSL